MIIFYLKDFISTSRKKIRPQTSDDGTLLTDQTAHVWDPDWSHPSLNNLTTDISRAAITTFSILKDYVRVTPFTIDAQLLVYNTIFNKRTGNNSLTSSTHKKPLIDKKPYKTRYSNSITIY